MLKANKIYFLLFFTIFIIAFITPKYGSTSDFKIRSIFDEAIYWASDEDVLRGRLNQLKRAGFNTYIGCIWHGQGAIWESDVVPLWYKNIELAKRDPLKRFIEIAHSEGFKVHPCITVMLRQHNFFEEFTSNTNKKNVFNVHNENFRSFMINMIKEVVIKYDIDGLNLDYVRTGQVCYDKHCQEDYQLKHNRNLLLDIAKHKVDSDAYNSIVKWQRDAMYDFISSISSAIREIDDSLIISVAAAPWAESVIIEGQDSISWANDGLVDLVYTMNYQKEIDWESLRKIQAKFNEPEKLAVMISNYYKDNNDKKNIISKSGQAVKGLVKTAANFNPNGSYSVYIYSMFNQDQSDSLFKLYNH